MPGPGGQWRGAQGTEEYRPVVLVAAPAHAALRSLADPRVPRPEPGVPGLVRPGPRAGADRQVAHRAGRRNARLVARRRVPDRRAVLDGPGNRPRGAAGRRGDGCPVGAVRSGRAAVAQAAAQLAAGAGRAGRGAEWLRSWQALGGPWAVIGVSQWQHPAALALAAVGGVWLISFALVLANVAIVLVIVSLPQTLPGAARLPGAAPRPWLAALGVVAAVASVGAGPLAFALIPASPAVRQVTVAMVQAGMISDSNLRV